MFHIKIPHQTPRNPKVFKGQIDFWKGYRGYIFYGSIFLFMAIIITISCFFPPYQTELILFKVGIGIVVSSGVYLGMFRYAYKKYKERLHAFIHGKIMKGKIIAHGKTFVPRKSSQEYTISIALDLGNDFPYILKARKSDKNFHQEYPITSEIKILFDPKTKSAFIPAEMDIQIE